MTPEQLTDIMTRLNLSREDVASIAGKTTRQVYSWTSGLFSVPRSVALVLHALDDGKIDVPWVVSKLKKEAMAVEGL